MKVESIEEYLGTLQAAMTESWKSHLKTNKYSKHIALNEFYDDVVDLVDDLIEEYQGLHGVVKDLKNVLTTDKMDVRDYLKELREMTEDGKKLFEEDELKSDIDAILSLIDKTLYKLNELTENTSFRSLADFLNECLTVNEAIRYSDAEKALCDMLFKKAKENRVHVTDDEVRELANEIIEYYDEEEEILRHSGSIDDILSFIETNIIDDVEAFGDEEVEVIKQLWDI